jgi:signal peptidase II
MALLLILGGAFGNLYDRLFRGYVVDFVDLYIGHWHWYFFNVADVYICFGAILLFIDIFLQDRRERKK